MRERFFRLVCGLSGYYVITLVMNPLLKAVLAGFAGTVVTCFLQMFYVVFAFPLAMAKLGEAPTDGAVIDEMARS
jgi:uncharacterized membrane protein